MRNTTKLLTLLMLLVVFQFTSCQKEEVIIIDETEEEGTLTDDSPLTVLMLRTSLNDGNNDDFIDGGNCFSIAFPYSVNIANTNFTLEDEGDYFEVLAFLEASGGTIDDIEIVFPITIVFPNYTETTINNQEELNTIVANCGDGIEIDCLDFIYPITFFVYNSETETSTTIIVNNDEEMYILLSSMNGNDYVSIDYPISVEIENDSIVQVTSNLELENLIITCESNDNSELIELIEYLTTDTWFVAYFYNDDDETSDFCEYEITFYDNETITAFNGTNTFDGTWNISVDDNHFEIELDFGNAIPFDELNEEWDVINATILEIELEDTNDDNGVDKLTFNREPTFCEGNGSSEIETFLTTDSWFIAYYFNDVDDTSDFCEYELTFNPSGSVIASNSNEDINGYWSVIIVNDLEKIVLDFGDIIPFYKITNDWDIINASNLIIEMDDVSSGNGTDYLTLNRTPTICEDDNTYLEQVLLDGQWLVAQYLDNGIDETQDYIGYVIEFYNNGNVTATYGGNVLYGSWDVTGNTQDLNLVLDFGTEIPFDEFNDDWDVLDVQADRVELEDISGGGGGTDTLVFEKL